MGITIRVSRGFPGLVIFLIGLALFALFILLAFLSFFLFFIPALHGVFYVTLGVLLASLVLMAIGVGLMIVSFRRRRDRRLGAVG